MNSGNLLNNLLNTTGTNATTGKSTVSKSRVDTAENFRDTLAQVRPNVAATKPATRKAAPESNRAETRQPADHAEARVKPKAAGKERPVDRPDAVKNAKPQSSKTAVKGEQAEREVAEPPSQREPSRAVSAEHTETPQTTGLAIGEVAIEMEASTLLAGGEAATPLEVDGEGALLEDEAGLFQETSAVFPLIEPQMAIPSATQPLTNAGGELEGAPLAISAAGVQLMSGAGNPDSAELGRTSGSTPSAITAGNPISLSGTVTLAPESAEAISDIADLAESSGDNPDFLLLGGKSVLGKLMEGNIANEKAIDSAKPTVIPTSLAEPLVRMAESQSPAARSFVAQTGVPVPVGQPQWSQAVGEKVLWLAAQNVSAAEIRLDPPDLGQLHVKVSINQDQATVTFTSPHPVVREALDQQLNRLREMFSEQGLNLVNVDVSDRSAPQQGQDYDHGEHAGASGDTDEEELTPVAMTTITSTRLVDHYA
jgi:flagellar hook-length control protein FliK